MLTSKEQKRLMILTGHPKREVMMKQVFVAAMLALLLAPLARAGAPEQTLTPWNSTRVIPASSATCAFPIQVHSEGRSTTSSTQTAA